MKVKMSNLKCKKAHVLKAVIKKSVFRLSGQEECASNIILTTETYL